MNEEVLAPEGKKRTTEKRCISSKGTTTVTGEHGEGTLGFGDSSERTKTVSEGGKKKWGKKEQGEKRGVSKRGGGAAQEKQPSKNENNKTFQKNQVNVKASGLFPKRDS